MRVLDHASSSYHCLGNFAVSFRELVVQRGDRAIGPGGRHQEYRGNSSSTPKGDQRPAWIGQGAVPVRQEKAKQAAGGLAHLPGRTDAVSDWQLAHDVYERGRRAEELKEYDAAIEAFTRVIELDPKNDSAFLHRGYCHYDLGDYASAISDLNQSLALQPNNSRAYAKRAAALSGAGQTAAAILDAQRSHPTRWPESSQLSVACQSESATWKSGRSARRL